jgi:hypothetical protein
VKNVKSGAKFPLTRISSSNGRFLYSGKEHHYSLDRELQKKATIFNVREQRP